MSKKIAKSITIGHSQHGKSTIAGMLFINLLYKYLDNEKGGTLVRSIYNNVLDCMYKNNININLKYALIYDGLRGDLYEHHEYKTLSTKPYTLEIITNSEIIELTDVPGHQNFIRKVCGSIDNNDIGIFVIDAAAAYDALNSDPNYEQLFESVLLKNDPSDSVHKGKAPLGYKDTLKRQRADSIKRRKNESKTIFEKISNHMHPPVLSGIYNYLFLAFYLGIRKFIFCVHKMDIVDYSEEYFRTVESFIISVSESMKKDLGSNIDFEVIPTAINFGETFEQDTSHNIIEPSSVMKWYNDNTLLNCFDHYKKSAVYSFDNLAETEPVRFQIDAYQTKPYVKRPTKKTTGHFIPYIHGYLHSGKITDEDRLRFLIKGDNTFYDPVRITFPEGKGNFDPLLPGKHHTIYLNNTDIKQNTKTRGENKIQIIYSGNFAIKDGEEDRKPIIITNELTIDFTFVGGWKYTEKFHAHLIYGSLHSQATFQIKEPEADSVTEKILLSEENSVRAKVLLTESLPFCSQYENQRWGRVVIEKNTFVIGVGSIISLDS